MDVNSSWSAHDWMNRGSELLDSDPWLAKRLLARGLQIDPNEAIAWFNLGNRPAPATPHFCSRARLSPLPGPTPQQRNRAGSAQQPWRRICSCLAAGKRGGVTTPSVLTANQGNYPLFERTFGPSHRGPLEPRRPDVADERTGLRRHTAIQPLRPASSTARV